MINRSAFSANIPILIPGIRNKKKSMRGLDQLPRLFFFEASSTVFLYFSILPRVPVAFGGVVTG